MSSEPSSIQSLRRLASTLPHSDAYYNTLFDTFFYHDDRPAVLVGVALLEGVLKKALVSKLIMPEKEGEDDLFAPSAPLRTFSAKIRMGFALGLYGPKARADLDVIREVRNQFAHSMTPITFATPEVVAVCKRIILLELAGADLPPDAPRSRFLMTVLAFTMSIDISLLEPVTRERVSQLPGTGIVPRFMRAIAA